MFLVPLPTPRPAGLLIHTAPPLFVKLPVKVLVALRYSAPAPSLYRPPLPDTGLDALSVIFVVTYQLRLGPMTLEPKASGAAIVRFCAAFVILMPLVRSEEHMSELQSLR